MPCIRRSSIPDLDLQRIARAVPRSIEKWIVTADVSDAFWRTDTFRSQDDLKLLLDVLSPLFPGVTFKSDSRLSDLREIIRGNGLLLLVDSLLNLQEAHDKLQAIRAALEKTLKRRNLTAKQFVGLVEGLQPLNALLGLARELVCDMTNCQGFVEADWREIVLHAGDCKTQKEGTDFPIQFLQALSQAAQNEEQRAVVKALAEGLGGVIDENRESPIFPGVLYLVMELTPDEQIKEAFAVTITPWKGQDHDTKVHHPGRHRLTGIAENDILGTVGKWLDKFLSEYGGPTDRLVIEFVLPRKLFCHKLHKARLGSTEPDDPFTSELDSVVAWTIRPSDYRKKSIRQINLEKRWAPPTKLKKIKWVAQPTATATEIFHDCKVQAASDDLLRCIGLGFEPPTTENANEDIVLALSAAGVPAVVWFHCGESGHEELEEKLRAAFIDRDLDELPLIVRDERLKQEAHAAWKNAVVVLDHHKRMPSDPLPFRDPGAA